MKLMKQNAQKTIDLTSALSLNNIVVSLSVVLFSLD